MSEDEVVSKEARPHGRFRKKSNLDGISFSDMERLFEKIEWKLSKSVTSLYLRVTLTPFKCLVMEQVSNILKNQI